MILKKGYKINVEEIEKLETKYFDNNNNLSQEILKDFLLEEFKINENEINGDKIVEKGFPNKEKYEIFISHSHNDKKYAQKLANFLKINGYRVFLDSEIWGSADSILKEIDNEYSRSNNDERYYDYTKRNFSTTHVHLLLISALAQIISKTPIFIFVESDNTISFSVKEFEKKIYTDSPWIYTELLFFKLFFQDVSYQIVNESYDESEKLNIRREINLNFLKNLTAENIEQTIKNYFSKKELYS